MTGEPFRWVTVCQLCGLAVASNAKGDVLAPHECSSQARLPNSCTLYWKANEAGGRTYYSDEVDGGVVVWDTCLTDVSTLLAAITQEMAIEARERHERERVNRQVMESSEGRC